jgi:hypothetical protein
MQGGLTLDTKMLSHRINPFLNALLTASDLECTWSFSYALRTYFRTVFTLILQASAASREQEHQRLYPRGGGDDLPSGLAGRLPRRTWP